MNVPPTETPRRRDVLLASLCGFAAGVLTFHYANQSNRLIRVEYPLECDPEVVVLEEGFPVAWE